MVGAFLFFLLASETLLLHWYVREYMIITRTATGRCNGRKWPLCESYVLSLTCRYR